MTHTVTFSPEEQHVLEWLKVEAHADPDQRDRAEIILNLVARLVASIEMRPPVINPTEQS